MSAKPQTRDRLRPLLVDLGYYLGLALSSFLAAVWATGLMSRSWELPLFYRSDALAGGAQFKGTLENGWYEVNPALGAPRGLELHPFPMADNLQFLVARVLGTFIDQWSVVYNLAYLLTYPAAAVAGAWFLRRLGVSRLSALVVGALFAFAPYHFMHGLPHLSLSMYFTVPLAAWLSMSVMLGGPLWRRNQTRRKRSPLAWLTPTTLGTLMIALVVGSTSSYYAVFGLLFLGIAVVVACTDRRWRDAVGGVAAGAAVVVVMLANMAPDILWSRSHVASPADFGRQPMEAELFGLKFTSLVFPTHWNRIGDLAAWRQSYDTTFPLPGEGAALGAVAAVSFIVLLGLPLLLLLRGRESGFWPDRRLTTLSLFTWIGLAFGAVGGLATIFALLVSPDIRAWNRVVVFIMLFALAAVAIGLDRLSARASAHLRAGQAPTWSTRRGAAAKAISPVLALVLLGFGLYDQVAPQNWALIGDEQQRWDNDEAYVTEVESLVPAGTMVFELPAMAFPESPPLNELEDYELMRPYLHSRDLRWSYGAVKGRPTGDWTGPASQLPPEQMAVALAAAGFGAIHIDRAGYPGRDTAQLEQTLSDLLGVTAVESPDLRWAFFDMSAFAQQVRDQWTPVWLDRLGSHLVNPPLVYWQEDFNPPVADAGGEMVLVSKDLAPTLQIVSQRRDPTSMRLTFRLRADGASEPVPVTVTWPDGRLEELEVGVDGVAVSRRLEVGPGVSPISFKATAITSLSLIGLRLSDPVLDFSTGPIRSDEAGSAARGGGSVG